MQRDHLPSDRVRDELQALLVLELAEAEVGASGFAAHALCRLAAGGEVYGERWIQLDLVRLVEELSERAADLGSLGVVSLQALDREVNGDDPSRGLIESALRASISIGAVAYQALVLASGHLSTGREEGPA